jgi:hypothetical protein
MANLKLKNPSGGSLNLVSADGASDLTVTFPAVTGTAMVSGNMPAFSAYQSSAQAVTTSVWTKIQFQTEEFDTNNNFASSTFTPTVAGYYQLSTAVAPAATATTMYLAIYKNGVIYKRVGIVAAGSVDGLGMSSLVYANGSTDYFDTYVYLGNSQNIAAQSFQTYFNGSMVRGA